MKPLCEMIQGEWPVLVDFYATWCGPCRVMKPIVEKLERRYDDRLRVLKIDVDEYDEESTRYGVRAVPTLVLFKNGQEVWRTTGIMKQQELEAVICRYC